MRFSQILKGARRLPMTSKMGHNYYKGTRTGKMGNIDKHGRFTPDYARIRTYVPPRNLCSLQPFVSRRVVPPRPKYPAGAIGLDGRVFLSLVGNHD
ncbi:ribosomal protein subunit L27 [Schizosaccharomyces japonicus yFS275]|uniref:Ribosomal protein subunit L27 n=1 Tax=Schizosaccharomyces japonicus (strain yFS275 / FY16936) TaxID=402676 RepID=B6K817_SCHJY|nr:ribosomal protein subunit L27 [Schizosaccharomyces japonicus yFS275]EEB09671.1 ribosomal protein subunit L27 [Schizosaccharomyces japonicus yFS275]